MDATCAIQASIHVFSLVRKYVSRILGTYQRSDDRAWVFYYHVSRSRIARTSTIDIAPFEKCCALLLII